LDLSLYSAGGAQILGLLLASALFWLEYVDTKDRYQPEPHRRLVIAFVLGSAAAGMAIILFELLASAGLEFPAGGEPRAIALYCLLLIGPIEEGVKILVACLFVFRWRVFDEHIDGFVYAAAISLGFASLENFNHLPGLPLTEQLARTATLPLTHSLFAAIWGLGFARAQLHATTAASRWAWRVGSAGLAMLLHGLYDFLIFAYQASVATSGLVLIIWLSLIYRARQLAQGRAGPGEPLVGPQPVG